jgi:oligoendopeptidase F
LFALALYDRYRKEGPSFAGVYESILLDTGRMDALEVTRRAGFDIEDIEFWRAGTSVFADQINEFTRLVDATRAHDR